MEYTIHKLANLSGVTVRTLHHYDQIGLLCPMRMGSNGYRIYGEKEGDLLQRILFYRELGIPLKRIKQIINADDFHKEKELEEQLKTFIQKSARLDMLIVNLRKTLRTLKGEASMSDEEKFEGFKKGLLDS